MLLGVKSSCSAGGEGGAEWKWTETIPLESLERGGSVLEETIESEILKFPGGKKFLGGTR